MTELTNEQIKYYKSGAPDAKRSNQAMYNLDDDRIVSIDSMADSDVINKRKKREKSAFKSQDEYDVYLTCVASAADMVEKGLM